MDKIFYIDSSLLGKCKRSKWGRYTIVMIEEKLTFGKVKVSTWGFDIPFAYAPITCDNSLIDHDIEKENCKQLKELIRTDAVTFTTEDYMRMKGYIK